MADVISCEQPYIVLFVPLIADKILSFLSAKDLYRAAQVCQSWAEIVKRIKRKRKDFSSFFWKQDEDDIDDENEILEETVMKTLRSDVKAHLNEVSTEPALSLNFVAALNDPKMFANWYHSVLPTACNTTLISCDGVIGMEKDQCVEVEAEDAVAVSSFFLPKLPGVEMKIRVKKKYNSFKKFAASLTKDGPVKAVILISSDHSLAIKGIDKIMTEQNNHLAVAGAFVESIILPSCTTLAITFSGERVKAASVVINSNVKKLDCLQCSLKRLKYFDLPEERSFAFMFACVSRGVHHWKEKNVEIREFRKLFPNTPLYGLYGRGEIGSDTCSEANDSTGNTRHQYCHSYSTVFMLISIC